MNRVIVIGSGGAGKSVLSRALAARTGLPLIHLDKEYWQPGWIRMPQPAWVEKVTAMIAAERWIMDGNFSGTMELRMERADTIVFIDFPRWRCYLGVLRRWLAFRGRERIDMAAGCPEQLDWSFLKWIWDYPGSFRPKVVARIERFSAGRTVVALRNPREVAAFLSGL